MDGVGVGVGLPVMFDDVTRYPLTWPDGWRRTLAKDRRPARFHNQKRRLTIARAIARVFEELKMLTIFEDGIIISTNLRPKASGLPYSVQAEPDDPGAAVWWKRRSDVKYKVVALDSYDRIADNIASVAATLHAMRGIERYGGAQIMERVYTAFLALPAPSNWRHVLGFEQTPTFDNARARFLELSRQRHPDNGGTLEGMQELNQAFADAKREIGGG